MDQNQPDSGSSLFQLNLDASNSYTLRSAASWARVLAICSIIVGILFFISAAISSEATLGGNRLATNVGMVTYVIMGIIMIVSAIFALNFGNNVGKALKTNDQVSLNNGFAGIRNYFALWGILMIICLLLMVVGVAGILSSR